MDLDKLISEGNKIAITGHVRPDGDCIGSTLALFHYIKENFSNKKPDIYLEEADAAFNYLAGVNEIKHISNDENEYDLFFVLDCASIDRIKPFAKMFEKAKKTICIDHHISNGKGFASENAVNPDASSTCEVLYGLLDKSKLNKTIAECLYTGIIHDTGVFKYECTAPETLKVASDLISYGFDFSSIIDDSFYTRTYNAAKALGTVLSKSTLFLDGYGIYSVLTLEEMKTSEAKGAELGGIVEQLRLTKGVEVAAFIYPGENGEKKISLRSKNDIDVSRLASINGGGGHVRAAGYSSYKGYEEIINQIINYVREVKG